MKLEIHNKHRSRFVRDFSIPSLIFKSKINFSAKFLYGYLCYISNSHDKLQISISKLCEIVDCDKNELRLICNELESTKLINRHRNIITILPLIKSKIYRIEQCKMSARMLRSAVMTEKISPKFLRIMYDLVNSFSSLDLDKQKVTENLSYLDFINETSNKPRAILLTEIMLSLYQLMLKYKEYKKHTSKGKTVGDLIRVYYEVFKKEFKRQPKIDRKIDPGILKNLLRNYSFDDCKFLLMGYVKLDEPFLKNAGYPIRFLPNSINKIIVKNSKEKDDVFYSSEISDEQLNEYVQGKKEKKWTGKEDWASIYEHELAKRKND